jgi:hypothetical protein
VSLIDESIPVKDVEDKQTTSYEEKSSAMFLASTAVSPMQSFPASEYTVLRQINLFNEEAIEHEVGRELVADVKDPFGLLDRD